MLNGRVRFAEFEADIAAGQLRRSGELVPIQDLPFRLLAALLEKPGEVVTRTDLASRLWGSDTFVDATAGLNTAMAKLREALGDAAEQPAIIETIPKRGYRFIGRIESPVSPGAATGEAGADTPAAGVGDGPADDPVPTSARDNRRWGIGLAVAAAIIAFVATTAYQLRADRSRVRVAVVLFDNETGRPEMARFAQGLTDAVVTELTAQPRSRSSARRRSCEPGVPPATPRRSATLSTPTTSSSARCRRATTEPSCGPT
jgi:DNA-binding winged helix-turn-helix (wHTH) protein